MQSRRSRQFSSVTTRSRAQKLNNLNESANELKNKNSTKRNKLTKGDLEEVAAIKQNVRNKSLGKKAKVGKSKKKNVSSPRLSTPKKEKDSDRASMGKDISIHLKQGLRDNRENNVLTNQFSNDSPGLIKDSNRTPKIVQRQRSVVQSTKAMPPGMTTPKSTPIKLNLTPHRSTKTPRKSPISLSSPKTHSVSISRLLKTPRKLSLTSGSNLYSSDSSSKEPEKTKKDNSRGRSVAKENSPVSPVSKSKRGKFNVKLKEIIHRFSKSPKIVLKSPSKKAKSSKSPSTSRKSQLKKSPVNITPNDTSASIDDTKVSSRSARKTPSSKSKNSKLRLLNVERLTRLLTASQRRDILAEPIVLLKRLSLESKPTMFATDNQLNYSLNGEGDVKMSKSRAASTTVKSGSPSARLKGVATRRISTAKVINTSANKLPASDTTREYNSPTQKRRKSSTPLMSSTPRDKRASLTRNRVNSMSDASILSVADDAYCNTRSKSSSQFDVRAAPSSPLVMDRSAAVEDASKSLLLGVAKLDTTYDVDEDKIEPREGQKANGTKDATYELKEPRTSGLRQMFRKRTAADANFSVKDNPKKPCRVHFAANVKVDDLVNGRQRSVGKSSDYLRSNTPRNSGAQGNIGIANLVQKSKKAELLKFKQKNALIYPLNLAKSSPKINRLTPRRKLHNLNAVTPSKLGNKIVITPKALESGEKKSEKKSSVKKVPNFRKMHEQMFAKSESVVDAKRRLETRHLEFATKKAVSEADLKKSVKPSPSDTSNSTYNRFGFKLRKAEATHVILKKQTVFSRQRQQHETRTVLKSVRMNRRFELQMKARNLNP